MSQEIIIFDTTMRDGELTPGITMNLSQKMAIAQLLEATADVIEVGYPGINSKDFDEIVAVAGVVKDSVICGLAGSNPREIEILGTALKNAVRARINIFTNVNLRDRSKLARQDLLDLINSSITLARNYSDDIQWSAFDAVRSDRNLLDRAIETAIDSGAKTICIPDTFGSQDPDRFSDLIAEIGRQVSNIDRATISVHCHNDRNLAVDNSLAAVAAGATQIECSINGLGARKGNADLVEIMEHLNSLEESKLDKNLDSIKEINETVNQILCS
ncbi:MAG: 2-isopropylmalate synthase [Pleurocapsa sp. MO_226.B13]|nr:2-isopropylmalate synthase [Pleurocapsa sp. MO_226.B13]